MAKKVTIDNLDEVIKDILNEYGDEVDSNINEITKKVGQTGAKALKEASKETFNGDKYYKGWTYKTTTSRLATTVTIYNNKMAGLTHLLEHGHAMVVGGRTVGKVEGRLHIRPVEEKLIKEYESEVKSKL